MIGRLMITIACASLVQSKPIMVSYGTNGGPIVPPTPTTTTLNPLAPKEPAPVHEDQSDDNPPPVYRAPTPNQYRNRINSYKPNPNIQLGTPLDIKYQDLNTLSQLQVQQQKAEFAQQQGLGYTGAQVFGVQEYEYDNARNKQLNQHQLTNAQQFVQQYIPKRQPLPPQSQQQEQTTQKPQAQVQPQQEQKQNVRQQRHQAKDQVVQGTRYTSVYSVREPQPQQQEQPQYKYQFNYNYNNNQHQNQLSEQNHQQIPGFGVAFSSGLRYYVPQFYYYDSRHQQQQQQYHKSRNGYTEVKDNAIYGQ